MKKIKKLIRKKWAWTILIVLIIVILRAYKIDERFVFDGEKGDNLLVITDAIANNTLPLLGPPTSHAWLSFPPLYYYLFAPILVLFRYNPYSYAYFGVFIGVISVFTSMYFLKNIIGSRAAFFAGLIMALSPLFIEFSLGARFFAIIPLLIPIFLSLFYDVVTGGKKHSFILGLLFGAMLNFHYTPLMLMPFIVLIGLIKRKYISIKDIGKFLLGIFIAGFPLFIYDAMHNLTMTQDFLLWFPYKILGFLHIVTPSSELVIDSGSVSVFQFFAESFLYSYSNVAGLLAIFIIIGYVFYRIWVKSLGFNIIFILLWFLCGIGSTIIHRDVPLHYYVPILSAPIIFISLLMSDIWVIRRGRVFVVILFLVVIFANFGYYFMSRINNASINSRKAVAHAILDNAKGKQYKIRRVGANSQFDKQYAQDYLYTLWYLGNAPVNSTSRTYTIYEGKNFFSNIKVGKRIFKIENVEVVKN